MLAKVDELKVVALLRYADTCSPPQQLHPDCPFSVLQDDVRSCGVECRDVLQTLLRPGLPQSRAGSTFAYDAKQILLSEDGRVPDANWNTASLLLRLRKALSSAPLNRIGEVSLHRQVTATNSIGYLNQRGFDADSIVRFGLALSIKVAVSGTLSRLWISTTEGKDLPIAARNLLASWRPLFEQHVVRQAGMPLKNGSLVATAMTGKFASHLDSWLQNADLVDVVNWASPSLGISDSEVIVDQETRAEALWIVERLTDTYLSAWSMDSLVREYKWLSGELVPVCPADQIRLRTTSIEEVSGEIARRTVAGQANYAFEATMVDQAVDYLTTGRRDAAAGLFDAARILHPNNAVFHNNYGFCLIPDRPVEALEALREAERLDPRDWVNLTNQAVALWRIGQPKEALKSAERALNPENNGSESAYLWDFIRTGESDGPEVNLRWMRVSEFLPAFGLKVAEQLQDPVSVARWRVRGEESETRSANAMS
jgi:hypothetical protein